MSKTGKALQAGKFGPLTVGEALDFGDALLQQAGKSIGAIGPDTTRKWLGAKSELGDVLADAIEVALRPPDLARQLMSWNEFYRERFRLQIPLGKPASFLPNWQPGFNRLLVVAQGLTVGSVWKACQKQFLCQDLIDLDRVARNTRGPVRDGAYAVLARAGRDADKRYRKHSAVWAKAKHTMTLLERLLLELKHFQETKQHLDYQCMTICADSLCTGGVPVVGTRGDTVIVSGIKLDREEPHMGIREVIPAEGMAA